ncbi:MAG: GH116 family glycosyl-hydrolase [Thermofilaceae archaeon]
MRETPQGSPGHSKLPCFTYEGSRAPMASFPLGGIGTGCVGLAANGRLVDWEIFNRPSKGGLNGFTHFAVKAVAEGRVIDARVMEGTPPPPYTGSGRGFGFGLERESLAGLPHFEEAVLEGTYPIARIDFVDPDFPGKVRVTAFNPFIPLDDFNSSIPAAFFEIEIENTVGAAVEYTVCLSAQNPAPPGRTVNEYREVEGVKLILMSPQGVDERSSEWGQLAIATDAPEVSYQEYWYRGSWFDSLQVFWREFSSPGRLRNRRYERPSAEVRDHASLAAHLRLNPGERGVVRFLIAWYYPNFRNYWNPEPGRDVWRNYYAAIFHSVIDVVRHCFRNWGWLHGKTREFRDCLFSSTYPPHVLDAVSANLSILKSPTVIRLEDGSLWGFEGCSVDSGCCEGSCAHVWRYALAPLYLFPSLDRSMWGLHLRYSVSGDGRMTFRLPLPPGRPWPFPHAAVDGQYGCLLRAYAYWKLTGDEEWLRELWPTLKRMVEYAWSESNADAWDRDGDGVIEGRQHNTFDVELFGPNPWLTGLYLAALKAAAEMAEHVGDKEAEGEYLRLFESGKRWVEEHLFNGEYFVQLIDLSDRSLLERFSASDPGVIEAYWDGEHREIKYQLGPACFIAQVEAQFYANLFGLGEVLDRGKVRRALESIYRHNFTSVRHHPNPCRIYALGDERGVVNCAWPKGGKPVIPIPYAEEVWSGLEYVFAAHLIQEGFVEEGLEVVKAVRERYDGVKRNPWSEIECGSNYARSLSSYALLLALSGFEWDGRRGELSFNPKTPDAEFGTFWCTGRAWGYLLASRGFCELSVRYGELELKVLRVATLKGIGVRRALVNGEPVEFEPLEGGARFPKPLLLREGDVLRIEG